MCFNWWILWQILRVVLLAGFFGGFVGGFVGLLGQWKRRQVLFDVFLKPCKTKSGIRKKELGGVVATHLQG